MATTCPDCKRLVHRKSAACKKDSEAIKSGKGPQYALCKRCVRPGAGLITVCSSINRPKLMDEML